MKKWSVSVVCCFALISFCFSLPVLAQAPPLAKAGMPSFKELDTNHDGRLSLAEVLAYAKKKGAEVQPFRISDVDLDGDGKLTPEEFRKAGISGFEQFGTVDARDLNITGDGYVSRQDLDAYFARKHREAFIRADADHDGLLTRSEFALIRF
ncbi:MAG: EF-hand domain-containing protein [Humidesulfovibrio sp.]|nr:EF-hand domain-containing protein [Humidesulfovibrio sp.]